MNNKKWGMIMVIGKPYSMDILESLFESPKRFTDLNNACPIEKTRAKRLKELTNDNLVGTIIKLIGKRNFIHYILTEKGENVFKGVLNLK